MLQQPFSYFVFLIPEIENSYEQTKPQTNVN